MACSRHGSRRCEYSRVLVLLLTMASCVCHVDSQTGEETEVASESADAAKKLEETVFTDMLRIVDHKFDTLTTRITALERAVSNLQFFSIRQFRQLSGSIQSTENDLEAVGNQVGQLEVNGRALKIAMTLLSRDMTDLKSTTNGMLGELESSVVYINDNVEKQAGLLKTVVEDTVLRSTRDITTQLGRRIEKLGRRQQKAQPESVNCTVDFSELNERIDLRFAMFKKETHNHFVKLIDAAQLNIRGAPEGKKESKDEPEEVPELETINEGKRVSEKSEKKLSSLTKKGKPSISAQEQREEGITTETPSSSGRYRYSDEYNETYYEENDQRIMRALTNMTSSVLQAVNYFRHTGRMLEQIMSNTDNLVSSQTDLMRKVEGLESLAFPQKTTGKSGEISNAIPGSQHQTQGDEGSTSRPLTGSSPDHCIVSNDLVNNMATIAKNGSQLLEVLTDLAQMSSVSLAQTTAALQDEVKRVEGVRTRMATTMLARSTGDKSDPVTQLTNTTQRIFKLVEAVASNTGWLPLIFRNVQHVETLGNRSLEFVTRNHAILRDLQRLSSEANARLDESAASPEPTISNKIPRIPEGRATGAPENTAPSEGVKEELVLDQESLETIYSTSLQLNRIMPALTKLLAEPDPLFTLVGGGRPDQGRVEIYNKGQWGTICHRELTHPEADVICHHLGFRGGISAGAGHFGPGAGISWSLNASCLATGRCAVVTNTGSASSCSHDLDAAVICDHMLRIKSENDTQQIKAGRLEIHHRGVWLPVCGEGWSGYSARVACQQMGYKDGREMAVGEYPEGKDSQWLGKVACSGNETRLDACPTDGWTDSCLNLVPAGVRCL